MPPKPKGNKKVKKTTPCVAVDTGRSFKEISKDELWDVALHLQEELEMTKKQKCDLVLEVDKAKVSWETSLEDLEEERIKLHNKRREMEEAKESNRQEVNVYQQKLRHVQSEQSSTITELKVDGVFSSSLLQRQHQHQHSELELHKQVHALQADCREKQSQQENSIKDLLLKHHIEKMKMERDYEAKVIAVEQHYYEQASALMKEKLVKLQEPTVNQTMESQVASLMAEQDMEIKNAQLEITATHKKLQNIKKKKKWMQKLKDLLRQEEKDLNLAYSENKHLREKLSELEKKRDELQRTVLQYNKDVMMSYGRQQKVVSREHREVTVQTELLRQAIQEEKERDEQQRKQTETIVDIQQKSRVKTMTLERKIAAVTETLETSQAQLHAALSVSSSDPETRSSCSKYLKELMAPKERRIAALREEVAQSSEENNKLLHDSKKSWKASGNLLHNSPFKKTSARSSGLSSPQISAASRPSCSTAAEATGPGLGCTFRPSTSGSSKSPL